MNDIELDLRQRLKPVPIAADMAAGYLGRVLSMISARGEGVWECDLSSGRITFLNDYFGSLRLRRAGIEFDTVQGRSEAIHPQDREAVDVAFSSHSAPSSVRYRVVGGGGVQMWLRDDYHFVPGADGEPDRVICRTVSAGVDEDSRTQLLDLFNARQEFVFVFDRNMTIVEVLIPEGMRLFHSREELIGTSVRELWPQGDLAEIMTANMRETMELGQVRSLEYHTDMLDKRYYWLTRLVPIGERVYFVFRDIGDNVDRMGELLEARRRAEEADRLKSAFLANMSHEIRTPLNAIVGFSQIIASENDPATREGYMDIIRTNSDMLMRLVSDILDISRLESGRSEMIFSPVGVNELLADVEMTHRLKIPGGVELRVEYLPQERSVHTDRNRVTQILFNFLSNAIKNTASGSITVGVEECDNFLRFFVSDTGVGIAEDKLENVFHRFEKLDESVRGAGLGLAISRALVERLGGDIWVSSRLGEGSRFHFTIPYRKPDADAASAARSEARKRILVAEESDVAYGTIEQTLGEHHELIRVTDGQQALGAFVACTPDLVILDIRMPALNGIETAKRIRAISPSVPIVGVTRNDCYIEHRWALESGCNDVIFKPYSPPRLSEAVEQYCEA